MSKWAGKYVIGLTGNIGTGKSVVRKMLEHLGAYGIDADALGHRAIAKGAPGYARVIEIFGRWVLGPDEQIDRGRLGKIVFNDPAALAELEKVVHPLVEQALDLLIRRATQPVVVIEAIKLLETPIKTSCDSIWVAYAPPELQLARLMQNRRMDEADARQRIAAQPPQEAKLTAATVVIKNVSSFEDTWKQVNKAWLKVPQPAVKVVDEPVTHPAMRIAPPPEKEAEEELKVVRGRPRDSGEIAALINRILKPKPSLQKDDIMAAFGDKAFLMLQTGEAMKGVIGWKVENLVARTTDMVIDPVIAPQKAMPALVKEMEKASAELQCEASLIFIPNELNYLDPTLKSLGYEARSTQSLSIQAWQEAALESQPSGSILYFKQLRVDRVLRPI